MVTVMAMVMAAIPAMAMVAIRVVGVVLDMAGILAPMVLRMVMLPLRLLLHNQQHRLLASNLARNPDEPAQGCVGSFLFNDLILIINPQGFV
jgi:hypothetical protein